MLPGYNYDSECTLLALECVNTFPSLHNGKLRSLSHDEFQCKEQPQLKPLILSIRLIAPFHSIVLLTMKKLLAQIFHIILLDPTNKLIKFTVISTSQFNEHRKSLIPCVPRSPHFSMPSSQTVWWLWPLIHVVGSSRESSGGVCHWCYGAGK